MKISDTIHLGGHSFKITRATINTIGGKKIAEEFNTHQKIDVHNIPVYRWLKFMEGTTKVKAIIHLDTKGKHIAKDSVINLNRANTYFKALKKKNLPPITGKFK